MGSVGNWVENNAGRIGADMATGGAYEGYRALTGQSNVYKSAADAVGAGGLYNSVAGAAGILTPASTAGVQQAATDAQNIQNQFLQQYQQGFQGQAPMIQASGAQARQIGQLPGITAAQMTPQQAQAAQMNTSGLTPWTQGQQGLAAALQNTISDPNASSVAQIQQQRAFAQQMAQQQGLAAALGRGGNTALAMRTAMNNVGNLGAQQASASALQRAQEVAQAQGQLGNVLQSGAGNALTVAGSNQSAQQATNLANLSAGTQAASQNAQQQQAASQFNAQQQQAVSLADQAAANNMGQFNAQQNQAASTANQNAYLTNQQQGINQQLGLGQLTNSANANQVNAQVGALNAQNQAKQITGNVLSTGAGILALSDARVKEDIAPVGSDVMTDFYAKAVPASWRYKGGAETRVGPMAQDLEKSAVGRTMVRDTPAGKAIDHHAALTALLASVADVGRRVTALEGSKKGRK